MHVRIFFQRYAFVAIVIILCVFFGILSNAVRGALNGEAASISQIDRDVAFYFLARRSPLLTEAAINITALGSKWVLTLVVTISVCYLGFSKHYRDALAYVVTAGGAACFNYFLKNLFEIPRPELQSRLVEAHGYSYPSGHSQASAAIYFYLAFILTDAVDRRTKKAALFSLFALMIGFIAISRIYLGVHYFSDVTGGFLVGLLWALTVHAVARPYGQRVNQVNP